MNSQEREYSIGYKQGKLMGRMEVIIQLAQNIIKKGVTDNYEEVIHFFNYDEAIVARIMDYLPVKRKNWKKMTDSEWMKHRDEFIERM